MIRSIVQYPAEILSTVVPESTYKGLDTKELARDLKDSMAAAGGLGLAAVQIGVAERAILVRGQFFLNPKITVRSDTRSTFSERCLSIPGVTKQRTRSTMVKVQGMDEYGNARTVKFQGIDAACAQHEIDHLNGITLLSDDYI